MKIINSSCQSYKNFTWNFFGRSIKGWQNLKSHSSPVGFPCVCPTHPPGLFCTQSEPRVKGKQDGEFGSERDGQMEGSHRFAVNCSFGCAIFLFLCLEELAD